MIVSSVSAAQEAVATASGGNVVCLSAGTYGGVTLTGLHSSNVTFQAVPGDAVILASVEIDAKFVTVHGFYVHGPINVGDGGGNDVIDHNDVGPTGDYGISILPSTIDPSGRISNVVISGNKIHDTSTTDEGDALRFDNWSNVTVTGNDIYNIKNCPTQDCHTDTLQSYNADYPTSGLMITKNYLHDNDRAQGFPFLADGGINNVTISDNLSVREISHNEITGMWINENIQSLIVNHNTYLLTSGSMFQSGGSQSGPTLAMDHNVFDSVNVINASTLYALTEGNNIFETGPWSFDPAATDQIATPAFGDPATDDYRLATNPQGIGIDWRPADQHYGP
jgi:hypothetical protein